MDKFTDITKAVFHVLNSFGGSVGAHSLAEETSLYVDGWKIREVKNVVWGLVDQKKLVWTREGKIEFPHDN